MKTTEYMTEKLLERFLKERVDAAVIHDQSIPGISRGYRPDFRSEKHRLMVEYDGPEHYRSAKKILEDEKRDKAFASVGYGIVRIPYFVQLTHVVIATLFGDIATDHGDFLDFPHGFITTPWMPADFCELGIIRFEADLERFSYIRQEILESLRRAIESCGDWRMVCPPSRRVVWGLSS
jgi:very-short-patch-repair endonuclease